MDMDEDFGFVERQGGGNLVKNKQGKLTNGNKRSNLHPDDDHDATSGAQSDQLDQSVRQLSSLSLPSTNLSFDTVRDSQDNNNNRSAEEAEMLKHIRTSVKPTASGSPQGKGAVTSSEKSKPVANGKVEKAPTPVSEDTETQLPLPQRFVVKYLGHRETKNLWGIKYTRRPVDEMVAEAKSLLASNSDNSLPLLKLEVTDSGITIGPMPQNNNPDFPNGKFPIEAISYGVQDLVYTRVFAMIVVKSALISEDEQKEGNQPQLPEIRLADIQKAASGVSVNVGEPLPFRCHAFVCDSRQTARKLTYSLAAAFHKFSKSVAAGKVTIQKPKKFAIDLRSPEDIEADLLDSEA